MEEEEGAMCDYVDVVTVSVVIALARVSSFSALVCARQKKKALRSLSYAQSMFKMGRDRGGTAYCIRMPH